ncbi:hypothetical protein [uncultured Nostoc sp.]|uniref:hypothetical protein n=1 Tax=uncultured Nostoc sp. TaxID=340711 RepID=UPI00262B5D87|nr:hypothetical protein [uncultured Nostoc sp.]
MQVKLYYDAIACYQKALTVAEEVLQEATSHLSNSEAIHIYVLSCQNLPNCHLAVGQLIEAETYLLKAQSSASELWSKKNLSQLLNKRHKLGFELYFLTLWLELSILTESLVQQGLLFFYLERVMKER